MTKNVISDTTKTTIPCLTALGTSHDAIPVSHHVMLLYSYSYSSHFTNTNFTVPLLPQSFPDSLGRHHSVHRTYVQKLFTKGS